MTKLKPNTALPSNKHTLKDAAIAKRHLSKLVEILDSSGTHVRVEMEVDIEILLKRRLTKLPREIEL